MQVKLLTAHVTLHHKNTGQEIQKTCRFSAENRQGKYSALIH
jgi:hypothetical protein